MLLSQPLRGKTKDEKKKVDDKPRAEIQTSQRKAH